MTTTDPAEQLSGPRPDGTGVRRLPPVWVLIVAAVLVVGTGAAVMVTVTADGSDDDYSCCTQGYGFSESSSGSRAGNDTMEHELAQFLQRANRLHDDEMALVVRYKEFYRHVYQAAVGEASSATLSREGQGIDADTRRLAVQMQQFQQDAEAFESRYASRSQEPAYAQTKQRIEALRLGQRVTSVAEEGERLKATLSAALASEQARHQFATCMAHYLADADTRP